MSGQADPWDAMVQNGDSDEDYIPTGADGIDDEDRDLEQDDDYRDADEGDTSEDDELEDLGDIPLSSSILGFSAWLQLMGSWLVLTDLEFETDAATMATLRELVANRAVRLVQRPRQMSWQVQTDTEDEDDDYDDISYWGPTRGLQRAGDNWYPKVTEPQPAGVKLLRSGDFGKARNRLGTPRNSNIYSRLRRMALRQRAVNAADLKHNLIPNTHGTTVAAYHSNIYVAQFSPGTPHRI